MIRATRNGHHGRDAQTALASQSPSHRRPELDRYFQSNSLVEGLRTTEPTGLIFLGGSAAIGSQVKKIRRSQGTDAFVRILAIDTDESTQAGSPKGLSFADDEFVHLKTSRVRAVTDNPKHHKAIVRQTGLDDAEQLAFHQRLVNENIQHAGQVRSYGYLALLSDLNAIRMALKKMIAELVGSLGILERQLASKNKVLVRNRISFHVVFSCAGGTGSSMALPVMSMLRALTKDIPCEIVGTMIMPSAFEDVLQGKPEQAMRCNANAYGTVLEFDGARSGQLSNTSIGVNDDEAIPVVASLFNHLFVVGRYQADGKDLRSLEAVYDAVALHLAGVIGTEIADRVMADEVNEASLKKLCPDPITKKQRYLSSLGAQALCLPIERMAKCSAARQLIELIRNRILGGGVNEQELDQQLAGWLARPISNEAVVVHNLVGLLTRSVLPQPSSSVRPLFRALKGQQRLYYRNRQFVERVKQLQSQFKQSQMPAYEAKLTEMGAVLADELKNSLKEMLNSSARSQGWTHVLQLSQKLRHELCNLAAGLPLDAETDLASAQRYADQLSASLIPLTTFTAGLLTSKAKQDRAAAMYQNRVSSSVGHLAKQTVHRVLTMLIDSLANHAQVAEKLVVAARRSLSRVQSLHETAQAGQRLTTDSLAELDMSTLEIDDRLYQEHALDEEAVLTLLCQASGHGVVYTLKQLAVQPDAIQQALLLFEHRFTECFSKVSVVDVLGEQLKDSRTARSATARLQHLFHACQPMWGAESGQLGLEFSDALMVGIPESSGSDNRDVVLKAIEALGLHRIRANGQYSGPISIVQTGDPTRIYAIRRSSGACLYYLPEVVRAKTLYDQWNRNGGHSVHIFNEQTMARIPSVIPHDSVDEGELAFAIGVALGWVASRGAHWYDNLAKDPNEKCKFVCRLASQWNGIAFNDLALSIENSSLSTLAACGRISYESKNDPEPSQRIGQGMEEAHEIVCQNGEITEQILEAFDALRTSAGDVRVADDFEKYCSTLRQRIRATDANYSLSVRMIERLAQLVNQLRAGLS